MIENKSTDAYYGELDEGDEELDLSFLDDSDDDEGADSDEP